MRALRITWAALAAAGLLTLAAGIGLVAAQDASVRITESNERYAFTPSDITVALGGTVQWTNDSDAPHTVDTDDGSVDSGQFEEGETFEHQFDTAGDFAYHCDIHPYMTGTVHVLAAGLTPPPTDTAVPVASVPAGGMSWQPFVALGAGLLALALILRRRTSRA
jgi:plastocyanin